MKFEYFFQGKRKPDERTLFKRGLEKNASKEIKGRFKGERLFSCEFEDKFNFLCVRGVNANAYKTCFFHLLAKLDLAPK